MANEIIQPAVDPIAAFQNRVMEKLKADIGAMLPDEVLVGLTKRAVEEQFFKERMVPDPMQSYYSTDRKIPAPSWFVTEVTKVATPIIDAEVKKFVAERKDVIDKAVKNFLNENNLLLLAMATLRSETLIGMESLNLAVNKLRQDADARR